MVTQVTEQPRLRSPWEQWRNSELAQQKAAASSAKGPLRGNGAISAGGWGCQLRAGARAGDVMSRTLEGAAASWELEAPRSSALPGRVGEISACPLPPLLQPFTSASQ